MAVVKFAVHESFVYLQTCEALVEFEDLFRFRPGEFMEGRILRVSVSNVCFV
jgi:hypothetical protein